ncbi:MAG: PorT family protein [Bacteroidales bacterium]|jgi:hypothetical protein|nr:PorT family protein [Bacteroidales bacterium]
MKTLILRKKEGRFQIRGMKRSLLSALCVIAFSCACFAQDVIVTKDSKKIEAKVTEISVEHVKYRLFNHQDGPVYTLPKSDIVTIVYQNGTVETFVSETTPTKTSQASPKTVPTSTQPTVSVQPVQVSTRPTSTTASVSAKSAARNNQIARFGVKFGLNLASEMVDEGSTDTRAGIHIGGFVAFRLGNIVDLQPEILYSMQGAKSTSGGTEMIDKFDYINVPLIVKIFVTRNRTFSIDLGPQFGYMVNAKLKSGNTTLNLFDYTDDLNRFDASIALGVSYLFDFGLDLYFRGNIGLTKIAESMDHKNSVFQLGVGYRF